MPLRPEDVVRKTFRSAYIKRGYDETEVDAFLEEVVLELRRLNAQVDELEAARTRPLSMQQLDEEEESGRVAREREQLELVRTERRELVAELAGLQSRLDQARADIETTEARVADATRAAEEAESRRDRAASSEAETAARLQRLTHEHDVLRGAHDELVRDLRTLRLDTETRASEVLGTYDPETLELSGSAQDDDIAIISSLASKLHDDFVEQGRAEGERLREQGRLEREQLVTEATAAREQAQESAQRLLTTAEQQADDLISGAREEREGLISEGTQEHDRLVREGTEESRRLIATGTQERERLVSEGTQEHRRLLTEAEEQRAGILADLNARRGLLEKRVDNLDRQQGAYRDRLRSLVEQQLASLDDEAWRG